MKDYMRINSPVNTSLDPDTITETWNGLCYLRYSPAAITVTCAKVQYVRCKISYISCTVYKWIMCVCMYYWRISAREASVYRDIHARRKYFLINVSPWERSSSGETLNWKQFQVREFPGILEPECWNFILTWQIHCIKLCFVFVSTVKPLPIF